MIQIFNDINNIPEEAKSCVLIIGNFDGIHIGHQHLIKEGLRVAEILKSKLAIMTFDPHPIEIFGKEGEAYRITNNKAKYEIFESLGVDYIYNVAFDPAFRSLTANDFIYKVLADNLHIRHLLVGDDFTFGKEKSGNVATLQMLSVENDFGFTPIKKLEFDGEIVSSSLIRKFIRAGDLENIVKYLGRSWYIEGEVIEGDKRGRELGFPTANQKTQLYARLPYGVYATKVKIEGEEQYRDAVTNYGIRPMFEVEEPLIESYVFDFNKDIYGKNMKLYFVAPIRGEKKFDSLEELKQAIDSDCIKAKEILSNLDRETDFVK